MASLFKRLFCGTSSTARELYRSIVEQSRRPEFFVEYGVPDTPTGRFEVLVLHLFLVMHRMREEDGLAVLARSLSEEAILDFDRNMREMGIGDLSVGRKVKSLAEGMYGRFGAYTDGLQNGNTELSEALRRNLFFDGTPSEEVVAAVVMYVKQETLALKEKPASIWQDGHVDFGSPLGNKGSDL
jgi:cytochrome b pre-mRNA-processing protein 3